VLIVFPSPTHTHEKLKTLKVRDYFKCNHLIGNHYSPPMTSGHFCVYYI
jgi:hypothetical protein